MWSICLIGFMVYFPAFCVVLTCLESIMNERLIISLIILSISSCVAHKSAIGVDGKPKKPEIAIKELTIKVNLNHQKPASLLANLYHPPHPIHPSTTVII